VGVAALVVHFVLGRWVGTAAAAGVLLGSIGLLCANLWPLLLQSGGRGVAELGVLLATAAFAAAAALGTLFALDKQTAWLGGSLVSNLAAHAHLAAAGWVGVTICALSFRFLPAFLLPAVDTKAAARRQVIALAAATLALTGGLLARSRVVPVAAAAVAVAFVAYLGLLARLVQSRRLPIDWSARHALASAAWLAATVLAGVVLAGVGAGDAAGARLAAAYGVAAVLGWMSNLVIGMSYKLFPGFVSAARAERARAAVPIAVLAVPNGLQPVVFVLFNAGLALTVAGLLAGLPPLAFAGTLVLTPAGLTYALASARTLAFVLVDPRRPAAQLAVLP